MAGTALVDRGRRKMERAVLEESILMVFQSRYEVEVLFRLLLERVLVLVLVWVVLVNLCCRCEKKIRS